MSDKDYSGCEFYKKGASFLEKPTCSIALYEIHKSCGEIDSATLQQQNTALQKNLEEIEARERMFSFANDSLREENLSVNKGQNDLVLANILLQQKLDKAVEVLKLLSNKNKINSCICFYADADLEEVKNNG